MKKQITCLSAAIITAACLLFSSTATNLPVKPGSSKNACTCKNTCNKDIPKQSHHKAPPGTTFPGIIYIEM